MSDSINESGFIEWLRELFVGADAESMFRWVIVAWLVLVAAMVVLDRLGTGLLGRSRPLEQVPPERARTWRWGRRTPPPTYSLLPTGTIDERTQHAPAIAESIPLSTRPIAALPAATAAPVLANPDYWRAAANPAAPHFGYENTERLERGIAPERYNPVTGRVESLDRDESTGALVWPGDAESPLAIGLLETAEDDGTDPIDLTDTEPDTEPIDDEVAGDDEEPEEAPDEEHREADEQDELEAELADEQDSEDDPDDADEPDDDEEDDSDDDTDDEDDDTVELADDSNDDSLELSSDDEETADEDDAAEPVERTEIEAGAE